MSPTVVTATAVILTCRFHYPLAVIADAATDVCSSRAHLRFASSARIMVMCRMIEKGTR